MLLPLLALPWAAGCDMDSLRSGALFPGRDAGADAAADVLVDAAPDVLVAGDGASDVPIDVDGADTSADAPVDAPADTPADLAAPTGMLSGTVRDSCGHSGIDALVGIGGRHTCAYRDKGSYFFAHLPLGTLKLGATKDGYALYEATVEIVAGGNIQDIQLVPADTAGGCATLPMPAMACTCTTSTCEP